MKKISLVFIVLLVLVVSFVYIMSLLYPTHNADLGSSNNVVVDFTGNVVSTGNGSSIVKSFSMGEVKTHNVQSDCYLVVDAKVYDITNYFEKHPGGNKTMLERCGQEVSGLFASIHSNFAWDLLGKYYIGIVGGNGPNSGMNNSQSALTDIETKVLEVYPSAVVVGVKPKNDFYVVKMIREDVLYELHVDASGKILTEEFGDQEKDWNDWDLDEDDV